MVIFVAKQLHERKKKIKSASDEIGVCEMDTRAMHIFSRSSRAVIFSECSSTECYSERSVKYATVLLAEMGGGGLFILDPHLFFMLHKTVHLKDVTVHPERLRYSPDTPCPSCLLLSPTSGCMKLNVRDKQGGF